MTTIAYDHERKQIAVDGRLTANGIIACDNADKTIENDAGKWFLAGATCDCEQLSKMKHNESADPRPDVIAFLVKDNQVYLVTVNDDGICEWTEINYNYSLGSGQRFALAALDFRQTAEEAVKYAATRDLYTGGTVTVFDCTNKGV